ncbi:MAG TPA: P1 family peptidase [Marmoricola sp.]|nr:P1 family peptidase [Marmoricola sp.]
MRLRELGFGIGGQPTGPHNAITDVAGVRVGHTTVVEGSSVRTGVTVVVPHDDAHGGVWTEPVFAGFHRLNGNGEVTGVHWIEETGLLLSPIALTNTHSVGVVRDALVALEVEELPADREAWALPVVAETWDGLLNDVDGFHVTAPHAQAAYRSAMAGPVEEGSVGGGTGMICHEFKGGIGTSSRVLPEDAGGFTVGVLVQANHGRRERLVVDGVPVGRSIGDDVVPVPRSPDPGPGRPPGAGSIIVVVATDAPLLPLQCRRLAQRAGLGIARTGGVGENSSGDMFLAFATGNRGLPADHHPGTELLTAPVTMLANRCMDPLFDAVVEATEESIVNAMLAAGTMTGAGGAVAHGLDPALLEETLRRR